MSHQDPTKPMSRSLHHEFAADAAEFHEDFMGGEITITLKSGGIGIGPAVIHGEKTKRRPTDKGLRLVVTRDVVVTSMLPASGWASRSQSMRW